MSDVLSGLSLLASKSDLVDLRRSVAVVTSRLTSLEQHHGLSAPPNNSSAPRLGGTGILPNPSQLPSGADTATEHSSDSGNNGGGVPRYYKLEFPKFDSKEDPLNWLNHCEQFFHGQRTDAGDRVWLATYHLTGNAQEWYFHHEQHKGPPDWDTFKDLCYAQFGPPIRHNPLGELKRLTQTTTVAAYQCRFLALASRTAELLTENQQVQLLTAGLREDLAIDVEINRPDDLQEAMSLARAFERKALKQADGTQGRSQHLRLGGCGMRISHETE
ncbi:hypothetical protein OsJ_01904 [Oryza sativa Japonica Group]|uniref:Retrotransposon gag domain-containing protein n=1 Tax=Oryza sativa subsp. japonica TaxID=39947 RepID=A2ZTH8_ORYSJ|nr:hypothetical protein OsJ_01904 [Oryza sativa Japonica Group]